MSTIANTFLTFSAIGNREDLSDEIYRISPTDTPFSGRIGKGKCKAVLHEWQIDALAAAAANAQLEGNDYTSFTAVTVTSRLVNRTQISAKNVIVAGTQDAVDKAGRAREFVYQMLLRSQELKRDIEFVLTNNQAPVTGNSTTARQLRPLLGWYATNSNVNGATLGTTSAAYIDGTQRALTEAMLKDVLQQCWISGGQPDTVMVGAFNKSVISGFAGNNTRIQDTSDKKLVAAIDVYVSDWGSVRVIANRFSRTRDAHVLDTSYWALSWLRPIKTIDLAVTGDATKGLILGEYTLEARNEAASGLIGDLTTS